MKKEKLEQFAQLGKEEKENFTLLWLTNLIKTEQLTIEDVIDILNNVNPTFSAADKFNAFLIGGTLTISSVSRLFGYGYAKSKSIISALLSRNIIAECNNSYKIIDKEKFKLVSSELFKGNKNATINK